jgi:hypothetical protein
MEAASAGGIYLFYKHHDPIELHHLTYIGIAEGPARPMRSRIEDRLRDDSCFDTSLDYLPRSTAASIIRNRLRVAMPRSTRDYTEKHLNTCDLVRASGRVLLNAVAARPNAIKTAERILIASACALKAPLLNRQNLQLREKPSADGASLARSLVMGLARHGWSQEGVDRWLVKIEGYKS